MVNPKLKPLLVIGVVAALGAMISSFAAGSHFEISSVNGSSNFDVRVGAGSSAAATLFGVIALVAFVGTIGVYLSQNGRGLDLNPAEGRTHGFAEFMAILRSLTKSKTDVWVGGVCGGLGEHTPLPAWVWRAMFLFFIFCYGVGVPVYACLWICLPQPLDENPAASGSNRATPYGSR